MLHVLILVIPLGLAGAVSPVMLTEQTVVLAGPNGRRAATAYAAAAAITLGVFVGALIFFGRTISLPHEPHLDAQLDILIGGALLGFAAALRVRRPKVKKEKAPRAAMDPPAAFAFGVVSMATNVTTLALVIPAAKAIAASDIEFVGRLINAFVLVALASIPAWLPIALTAIAPGPAERGLRGFGDFIQRSGRTATVILLAVFGAFLIARGLVRIWG